MIPTPITKQTKVDGSGLRESARRRAANAKESGRNGQLSLTLTRSSCWLVGSIWRWGAAFSLSHHREEVTGFLVDDAPSGDPKSYTSVCCLACGQMHLVNFTTGKTVRAEDEEQ